MISVTLYSRKGCRLCEDAEADLKHLQGIIPHQLTFINIEAEPSLYNSLLMEIPVIEEGTSKLKTPFTRSDLKRFLEATIDQH